MKNYKFSVLVSMSFLLSSIYSSCQTSTEKKEDKVIAANDSVKKQITNASGIQKPESWVNDYENILDKNSIDTLTFLVNNFSDKTSITIAVVTTSSFSPFGNINEYTEDLGNKWGIGLKEVNNGIMVAVSASQRSVRIFTGLGMDQLLSDEAGLKIINEQMLPNFRQGNYPAGIISGVKEIIRVLMLQAEK